MEGEARSRDPDFTRERYEGDTQERSWDANVKRSYDEFQQESLETIREMRTFFSKLLTDAQQFDNARQSIANQSLQNAVETANMVSKQAIRHTDLAIDRQWNIDEVSHLAAGSVVSVDAIIAALAAAVAAEINKTK